MAASYFLLLAQKKVTQEKGTLADAVCRASMPGKLREQAPGFAVSTSLCSRRTRAHPARARVRCTRLFPAPARRGREGPGKSRARQSLPQKHLSLPFGFPLSSGG